MNLGFTEVLLVALALILVVAAIIDVRTYTISNRLNLAVALLAPLYWWSAAIPLWPDAALHATEEGGADGDKTSGAAKSLVDNLKSMLPKPKAKAA